MLPYPIIFLFYVASSKKTQERLGKLTPASLIGPRDETDVESQRLYKKIERHFKTSTKSGEPIFDALAGSNLEKEIHRFQESVAHHPERLRAFRERVNASEATAKGVLEAVVRPLLCVAKLDGLPCDRCEEIIRIFREMMFIAPSIRAGEATEDDAQRLRRLIPDIPRLQSTGNLSASETAEGVVERRVFLDVLLFLWLVASVLSVHGRETYDIDGLLPASSKDLGKHWVEELDAQAQHAGYGPKAQPGRPSEYRHIAEFLKSGDEGGDLPQSLIEDLSAIARGKIRLTYKRGQKHLKLAHMAVELETHPGFGPARLPEGQGLVPSLKLKCHLLGGLQFAKDLALSDIRDAYPKADIDAVFDAGLACWPELVAQVRS